MAMFGSSLRGGLLSPVRTLAGYGGSALVEAGAGVDRGVGRHCLLGSCKLARLAAPVGPWRLVYLWANPYRVVGRIRPIAFGARGPRWKVWSPNEPVNLARASNVFGVSSTTRAMPSSSTRWMARFSTSADRPATALAIRGTNCCRCRLPTSTRTLFRRISPRIGIIPPESTPITIEGDASPEEWFDVPGRNSDDGSGYGQDTA